MSKVYADPCCLESIWNAYGMHMGSKTVRIEIVNSEGAMAQTVFSIDTRGPGLVEFTGEVTDWVRGAGVGEGLLTLFVRHTSCSLLIQENADPDVRADLESFFGRLVPPADRAEQAWITHRAEGPDDMPAHIKAALLPVSFAIPVADRRPLLGTWQGIYLFEHRARPHRRQVAAHLA